jgi:DEAD/DEAH box helicase domain-containing protein
MRTTAFWLHFPEALLAQLTDCTPTDKQNGITGLANALRTVAALILMCDPRDLGVSVTEDTVPSRVYEPNLYLYDAYPGGIGQSQPLFGQRERLLRATADMIRNCPCESGCPSCVGPIGEIGERGKQIALDLLSYLAGGNVPSAQNHS